MPDPEHDEVAGFANRLRRATIRRALIAIALGLTVATAGALIVVRTDATVGLSPREALQGTFSAGIFSVVGLIVATVGGIVLVRALLTRR